METPVAVANPVEKLPEKTPVASPPPMLQVTPEKTPDARSPKPPEKTPETPDRPQDDPEGRHGRRDVHHHRVGGGVAKPGAFVDADSVRQEGHHAVPRDPAGGEHQVRMRVKTVAR